MSCVTDFDASIDNDDMVVVICCRYDVCASETCVCIYCTSLAPSMSLCCMNQVQSTVISQHVSAFIDDRHIDIQIDRWTDKHNHTHHMYTRVPLLARWVCSCGCVGVWAVDVVVVVVVFVMSLIDAERIVS